MCDGVGRGVACCEACFDASEGMKERCTGLGLHALKQVKTLCGHRFKFGCVAVRMLVPMW